MLQKYKSLFYKYTKVYFHNINYYFNKKPRFVRTRVFNYKIIRALFHNLTTDAAVVITQFFHLLIAIKVTPVKNDFIFQLS